MTLKEQGTTSAASRVGGLLRPRLALLLAAGIGLGIAMAVLYVTPPERNRLAPPCLFHRFTGLHCPGCGATRAVHALLHLRLGEAVQKNALFITALPFVALWSATNLMRWVRGEPVREPGVLTSPRMLGVILIVILAFAVLRNLPWAPFTLLAPD